MRKLIFILMLVAFKSLAETGNSLFAENSFVAIVRDKQSGIYYGDSLVRQIVNETLYAGVFVLYKDPSKLNSRMERSTMYKNIASRLNRIKPSKIYINRDDTEILDFISDSLRSHIVVLPTSLESRVRRYSNKLLKVLLQSRLDFDKIYILKDSTDHSRDTADYFKRFLTDSKQLPGVKIELVQLKSFQDIRKFFNGKLRDTPAIVLNVATTLFDREVNRQRFADDLKAEIADSNNRHLDIGFSVAGINEALIITDDPSDLFKQIQSEDKYISVRLLINKERLEKLRLNSNTVNYFYEIDGIL